MADQKSNAGNLGDLIKHMLLVEIVKLYSARTAGWTYFETHAGYYTYPVEQLRNQEGDWSGERKWSLGVIANADSKSIGDFGQSVQSYVRSGFYPINNTTLLRRFVDWRKSSGFSYIEFEYEHYEVGKGWAGQDMRGAGILFHGFNASTLQSLMVHATKFQALFCGKNEGSRDITLRMTVSLASPSDHPRTSTSS